MKTVSPTPKHRRSRLLLPAIAAVAVAAVAALLLAGGPAERPAPTAHAASGHPTLHEASATSRADIETLVAYNRSIALDRSQEAVREEALTALPAPCCAQFSAATCCCECNLSRAIWGLSKYLITTLGYDAEQVRAAVTDYYAAVNPDGFPGDSCGTGKCGVPFAQGGCGGMRPDRLAF